jgi:hypothetical protein
LGEPCGRQQSNVDSDAGQLTTPRSVAGVPVRLEVRTTKTGRMRRVALDKGTLGILCLRCARARATRGAACTVLGVDTDVCAQQTDHGSSRVQLGGPPRFPFAYRADPQVLDASKRLRMENNESKDQKSSR